MKLKIEDLGKIENAYTSGGLGYAEYKILTRLALKEAEIKEDKRYCVSVDTRTYIWDGKELIELCKIIGVC